MYILKVMINRNIKNNVFDYGYESDIPPKKNTRVWVYFGKSKTKEVGFIIDFFEFKGTLTEYCNKVDYNVRNIDSIIDEESIITPSLFKLAMEMSTYYVTNLLSCINVILPPFSKVTESSLKKTCGKYVDKYFKTDKSVDLVNMKLTKSTLRLYERFCRNDYLLKSEISAYVGLQSLIDYGLVDCKSDFVLYDQMDVIPNYTLNNLTKEQEIAYNKLITKEKNISLLHGVTGSGKTEIYIHIAKYNLEHNKSTLILLPEVAMSESIISKFNTLFPNKVFIIRNDLSDSSKYYYYQQILNSSNCIVIGIRSAVFSPINNLETIIIDEEHTRNSYKNETMPTYTAFEVVKMRSKIEGCKIIIASGTPLIEDKALALKGVYEDILLPNKFSSRTNIDYEIVDISDINNILLEFPLLSNKVLEEIDKEVIKKNQVLILLNRKGFSIYLSCNNCQNMVKCPNCDCNLIFYKNEGICKCNHCGYQVTRNKVKCDHCDSYSFSEIGYGTERVVEEISRLRPDYKILRLDSSISSKIVRKETLNTFEAGEADILIGTQVISKGHNFSKCTLAVCLDCDFSLHINSFSASEECFDLIAQLRGRLGRFEKDGKLLIQTRNIENNPVLSFGANDDYDSFYNYEIVNRKVQQFPPFTKQIRITIKNKNENKAKEDSLLLKNYLVSKIRNVSNIFGPIKPYISKINNEYIFSILIQYKNRKDIQECLEGIKELPFSYNISMKIDVDPID